MKRILFFPALLLSTVLIAQTTRTVLFEEFTNASCSPCAAQNPAFNSLLDQNSGTVIPLKYQTSWPGADPMNAQTSNEVSTRVNYYSVTGVPHTKMDGNNTPTGSAYAGAPANVTQSYIDNQSSVMADFSITASHSFNSSGDSATVNITLSNATSSALSSGSSGSLKLRVALVEEEIKFPFAPGSNGEKDFFYVMRKMLPNASGTTLQDSWSASSSKSYSMSVKIPDYIYNLKEMGFVIFIQDDSNKEVKNAAYSAPLSSAYSNYGDISSTNTSSTPSSLCASSISPKLDITNETSVVVTSAKIDLLKNGTVVQSQNYSGSLSQGNAATVNFSSVSLSGSASFDFEIVSVNGNRDFNRLNNLEAAFDINLIDPNPESPQYDLSFETGTDFSFPSDLLWLDEDFGQTGVISESGLQGSNIPTNGPVGGFGNSSKSLFINFVAEQQAEYEIVTKKVGLSAGNGSELAFSYAYAGQGVNDKMEIFASTDCGATWTSVWSKTGTDLETGGSISGTFYVPQSSEWVRESVDLSQFDGESEVLLKFHAKEGSNNGNMLYLDDVSINDEAVVSLVEESGIAQLNMFPNPANDQVTIEVNERSDFSVVLITSTGQKVMQQEYEQRNKVSLNTSSLAPGIYFAHIEVSGEKVVKRIAVKH